MRSKIAVCCAIILASLYSANNAAGQVEFGGTVTDKGLQSFYVAVGQYYRVPERQIIVVRERRIPDEEIPVVFFIAKRARVEPTVIIDMRNRGQSWMDISLHYGIGPEVYYVPVTTVYDGPYGKAYGYYKKRPKNKWKTIRLSDADIVNFVNLRFVSSHYGYSAPQVIKMRSGGKSFVAINDEVKGRKHNKGKGKRKG